MVPWGLEVIVGGGVRRGNVRGLVEGLRANGNGDGCERAWFHSSCLGEDERFDEEEAKGLVKELGASGVVISPGG